MTEYSYGPGEWTALAEGGRGALLDPAIDSGAVDEIWASLSQGGTLESWLEVLAGKGLAALPSFGFVEPGDDGVRVVVRGEVIAHVGDYEISAGGMRTWREHVAPAGAGVILRVGDSQARYPLLGGVVLAATLQVGDVEAETDAVEEPASEDEAPAPAIADDAAAAAVAVADAEPESASEAEPESASEAEPEPEPQPDVEAEPGSEPDVEAEPASEQEPEPAQQSVEESAADEVEPDFVLDDDDDADDEGDLVDDPEGDWAKEAAAVQLEHLPDAQQAAGEELPPWAPPPGVAPQASQWGPPSGVAAMVAPVAAPELGDHDGYTMRAADLPASDQQGPVDHTLAPAHEDDDHGGAVDPHHAQLSLSTGQQIELDRPVLIGRAPESSRFGFGETPRLVTVPSPQQDISRTHVEIKLEGDNVLVTDLRSTNGTVVVLPGSPPRRLHPGESVPVPTGTVVDLGDGVTAVVDPPSSTAPIAY